MPLDNDFFDRMFPYYLSIGMTSDQYWHGNPILTEVYQEAYMLEIDRKSRDMWLQGFYIYEAVATAIHNGFADPKKNNPIEYRKEPIPLTEDSQEQLAERKAEESKKETIEFFNRLRKK